MYTQHDLEGLDRKYFSVILADEYDITLMSKNTRHIWQLHSVELPDGQVIVTFHKHRPWDPYHTHNRSRTLKQGYS